MVGKEKKKKKTRMSLSGMICHTDTYLSAYCIDSNPFRTNLEVKVAVYLQRKVGSV